MTVSARAIEDYIQYWERLSVRSVRLVEKLASVDMAYTDPFFDVRGIDDFEDIIRRYADSYSGFAIRVTDYASGRDGHTVYFRWEARNINKYVAHMTGMSEVMFDQHDKVIAHYNLWDTGGQIMAHIPLWGQVFKWFRRRIMG